MLTRYIRPFFSHTTEIEVKKKEIVTKHEFSRSRISMYGERTPHNKDESILMTIRNSPLSGGKYNTLEDEDLDDMTTSKKSIARSMPADSDTSRSPSVSPTSSAREKAAMSRLETVDLE